MSDTCFVLSWKYSVFLLLLFFFSNEYFGVILNHKNFALSTFCESCTQNVFMLYCCNLAARPRPVRRSQIHNNNKSGWTRKIFFYSIGKSVTDAGSQVIMIVIFNYLCLAFDTLPFGFGWCCSWASVQISIWNPTKLKWTVLLYEWYTHSSLQSCTKESSQLFSLLIHDRMNLP